MINKFGGGMQIFYQPDGSGGSNTGNPIELLISLGINEQTEKKNLQTQIDNIKGLTKDIDLILSNEVENNLNGKIDKLKLNLVKLNGTLNLTQTRDNINAQLKSFKVDDVKINATINDAKIKSSMNEYGEEIQKTTDAAFKNFAEIRDHYTKQGFRIKTEFSGLEETEQQIKRIIAIGEKGSKNVGKTINFVPNVNGGFDVDKTILDDKLYKNLDSNLAKATIKFDEIKAKAKLTANYLEDANKHMSELLVKNSTGKLINDDIEEYVQFLDKAVKRSKEIRDSQNEWNEVRKSISDVNNEISRLNFKGILTNTEQIEKLKKELNSIKTPEALDRFKEKLDDIVQSQKDLQQLNKVTNSLENEYKSLLAQIVKIEKMHPRAFNPTQSDNLRKSISNLNSEYNKLNDGNLTFANMGEVRAYSEQLNNLKVRVKEFSANASEASRNSMGLVESFKIAMEKFPVWMAASTVFYSAVRTAREFMRIIVDIDTKMTDLKKVMSSDTDFSEIFDRATESAQNFGQSISEVMNSYTEFARQGYKGSELGDLADAGLIASNVGEMTAQKASEYMTASLIQWKMDAKDAMGIIDSWNQISNTYATTTEKLAAGQAKAGATARAMGLDFDQLNAYIGTVTAATKQSGDEIGNFIKSTLPRLTSEVGQSALGKLGVSLTDEAGNMRDVMQVYTEVAQKVKNISDTERIAVTEGLAGKYHISRMQALLDDLGSADSMYQSMYESSKNSAGSAMQENERYMQSLQARINLVKVEIEKLALAIGDAFLSEGMITAMKLFSGMIQLLTKLVDIVGALPIAFFAVNAALLLFSNRYRGLITSLTSVIPLLKSTKTELKGVETGAKSAEVGVNGLRLSWKAFVAFTGFGLIISYALEVLFGWIEKNRQATEELESENKQLLSSYSDNASQIDELVSKYKNLQGALDRNPNDLGVRQEYLSVQTELANLMPSLVQGEDSYGNKLIGNADIVKNRIELLKQQLEVERALNLEKAKDDAKEKADTASKEYKTANNKKNTTLQNAGLALTGLWDASLPQEINNLRDLENAIRSVEEIKKKAKESGKSNDEVKQYDYIIEALKKAGSQYAQYESQAKSALLKIRQARLDEVSAIIEANKSISDSDKNVLNTMFSSLSLNANSKKSIEDLANVFMDGKINNSVTDLSELLNDFKNITVDNFDEIAEKSEESFETLRKQILKDSGLSKNSQAYKDLNETLKNLYATTKNHEKAIRERAEAQGISVDQARLQMAAEEDNINVLSEEIAKLKDLKTAQEQIVGISQNQVDKTYDLIFVYQTLKDQTELTTEQTIALNNAQSTLMALYPHLVENGKIRIEAIIKENEANEILLKGVEAQKNGQLTAEQQKTLASALGAKTRIENMSKELQAASKYAESMTGIMDAVRAAQLTSGMGGTDAEENSIQEQLRKNAQITQEYQNKLKSLTPSFDGYISQLKKVDAITSNLSTSNSASTKSTNSSKNKDKEITKSIYVTDKFKRKLEEVNAAITKQEKLLGKYPTHSAKYRTELKKLIKLEEKKKKLYEDEYALLDKQIKSGKILQKGNVTVKTKNNSSSTTKASNKTSGYTGKYSSIINKYAKQYNLDPNLIAGLIKQESSFNPKAKSSAGAMGLMQLMPATAKSLGVKNAYNPEQNIKGGTKYFAQLLKQFGGDIEKALRAYNAGPKNVSKSYNYKETNDFVKKVTSNYNAYLKKATNSVTKTSNAAVNTITTTVKKTTNRYLAGWSGKITSHQGNRTYTINGKKVTDYHRGVDIAGKKGQKIESNVNGTVVSKVSSKNPGTHSSYGNMVIVKGTDGKYYKYAHLDSKKVKAGDKVKIGQVLGTMGKTGNATGVHLHYEVVDKNNKVLDPYKSLTKAKGKNKVTTTRTASTSGVTTSNKEAIDQAKSDRTQLKTNKTESDERIQQYRQAYVNSMRAEYAYNRSKNDYTIVKEQKKRERSNGISAQYRSSISTEISKVKDNKKITEKEIAYIEKKIKDKDLDSSFRDELKEELKDLRLSLQDYTNTLYELEREKVNSQIERYEFFKTRKDESIAIEESKQFGMDTASESFLKSLRKQAKYNLEKKKLLEDEIAYTKDQLKNTNLTQAAISELKTKLNSLTVDLNNLNEDISNIRVGEYENRLSSNDERVSDYDYLIARSEAYANSLGYMDSNKITEYGKQISYKRNKKNELVADNSILYEALKDPKLTAEEKKAKKKELEENELAIIELEADIRSMYSDVADYIIEQYKKVYEKQKELALKAIDDERTAYSKLINDKIKAIDKLEKETTFQEDRADKQDEINKKKQKINSLLLDDSKLAKAERKKLQEELAQLEKEYSKWLRQHNNEEQKEALQEQLDSKNDQLDKEQKAIEKHYEDILNDERRWAQISEEIIKGNVDAHIAELDRMKISMNANMDSIGKSITKNLIDNLDDAIKKAQILKEYNIGNGNTVTPPSNTPISWEDNYKPEESLDSDASDKAKDKSLVDNIPEIDFDNIKNKTPLKNTKIQTDEKAYMKPSKSTSGKTMITIPKGSTVTFKEFSGDWAKVTYKDKTGWIKKKRLVGFDTGGYTGNNIPDSGALALLHKKELILNENQTSDMLKVFNIFDKLNSKLTPRHIANIQRPQPNTNVNDGIAQIAKLVQIENFYGTEQEMKDLSKTLVKGLKMMGVNKIL